MRAAPQKWLYICVEVLQVPVIHQKGQLVEQHCPLDKSYPLLHDVHTSVGVLVAKEHWWGYAPTAAISPFMILVSRATKKVQVGKDQEKAKSERDSHSKNRGGKNPNKQPGTYTMKHIVSPMSSYFPIRWPLSYLNLIKNMKTHTRRQQHKKKNKKKKKTKKKKHHDIKQKEPPQKYRLGTISNTKLLAGLNRFYRILTSPSASAVVHNI